MLTFLHAADFHLDSPFRSLPPREAQRRRADQRQGLESLRDLALEHRTDLVLLAGDLFDSQEVYPETLEALVRVLGQLPCPVVIAPGNHDYFDAGSPYAKNIWPSNVHIFRSETVTSFSFPALGVTVYGCAFTSPYRDTDPLAGFTAPREGGVSIGLFHGDVAKQSRYAPIAPESLARSGLAYAALGHVHAATDLHMDLPTPWAYAGCPQGRGFDELGQKGVLLVRLEEGKVQPPPNTCHGALIPLPGPRYWELKLPLSGDDPADAIARAMGEGYQNDYLRLTLTGESEPLDLPPLRSLGERMCRVFELRDETVPPLDLWARTGEDTLTGHFLREMRARMDVAAPEELPLLQTALRCGLAALEGRECPL